MAATLVLVLATISMVSCANYRLVFEDNFNSIDKSKWEYTISSKGGGNGEFQIYTPDSRNSFVKNGALYIKPTLTSERFGESFVWSGTLNLWDLYAGKCTDNNVAGCYKKGFINPVMSARMHTKTSIKFGKVEVWAKLPGCDWCWPAIWMLPTDWVYGGWPASGEIDLMESRGNRKSSIGPKHMASTLHWGVTPSQNRYTMTGKGKTVHGTTFADGFHKYVLEWDSSGIRTFVDDDPVLNVRTPSQGYYRWGNQRGHNPWAKGSRAAPFDQKFHLILNVAVGGTNGFFPDNMSGKPWRNRSGNQMMDFYKKKNDWYRTWTSDDAAMQIRSVKMWQLA